MDNKNGRNILLTALLFIVFIAFTVLVCKVDVAAIGPMESSVGCSKLNGLVARLLPYNETFYKITKYLGYFALLICAAFAVKGISEFAETKSLRKVDPKLVILGIYYVVVIVFYVMFNKVVVNYRPVLEDGALEASYPSSHTMLAVCVFLSTIVQIALGKYSDGLKKAVKVVMIALTAVMVVGRLISGVHWFTDIVGGVLLSAALFMMYYTAVQYVEEARLNAEMIRP